MVQNIDYAPTFLELTGNKVPSDMQGNSLAPLFEKNPKQQPEWRNAVYYHYYEFPNEHMVKRHYGIRTERYKLVHFYFDIDSWEFYDLENDPYELNNLFGKPEYTEVINRVKTQLKDQIIKYKDNEALTIFEGKLVVKE